MSHVLVSAPFEQHAEFFYPPRAPKVLFTRDKPPKPINTADAAVRLADIPFVRLRQGQPHDLLEGRASYTETVARSQSALVAPRLVIDMGARRISCHDVLLRLEPQHFALYALLARLRTEGQGGVHWSAPGVADIIVEEYRKLDDVDLDAVRRLRERIATDDGLKAFLEQVKSRINSQLRRVLGQAAARYLIATVGKVGIVSGYHTNGLLLSPEEIAFGQVGENPEEI